MSADEPFVFVFIPCLVDFFDVCDMYCVLLLSNGCSFTRLPSVETLSLCVCDVI